MNKHLQNSTLIFQLFILLACSSPSSDRDVWKQYASLSDSVHYVGINTCAGCHRDIYDSYIQTGMGKSFDVASVQKSSAVVSRNTIIHDHFKSLNYHPQWYNDSLFLTEFRLIGNDTQYVRTEKINYIVGSGQHTNSHLFNINGYLYQAPATFYTQKGVWDLPPGFENGNNSRFNRKIELECMSCHNAYPRVVLGSENKYDFVANGIDCERCHGPGSKHVEEKRKGNLIDIDKEIDYTIVNPAKLPIALQLDVCQRCHIQGNAVLNEGKSFFDFKPGMHLSDVMNVFMPVYKGQEDEHIMASHAERMKMSKCFINSLQKAEQINKTTQSLKPYENAMTCITCHNPHVSVKVTGKAVFNSACNNCHQTGKEVICIEDRTKRQESGDNCISCHMPKNSTIDIPHVRTTDHFIRKPMTVSSVDKIKEFIGIACINNSMVDSLTIGKAYLSYYEKFDHKVAYLDSARKYLGDGNETLFKKNYQHLIRWAYLKNDFKQVTLYAQRAGELSKTLIKKHLNNEDAWTAYRIGESYSNLGLDGQAIVYFQKAVDLAPYILEFRNKLGASQIANRLFAEATKSFEFIVRENPKFASAYINLGYLKLTVYNDLKGADVMYDCALALDPDNEQALLNKAGTLVFLNKTDEAKKYLKRILAIDPGNKKAMLLVKSLE